MSGKLEAASSATRPSSQITVIFNISPPARVKYTHSLNPFKKQMLYYTHSTSSNQSHIVERGQPRPRGQAPRYKTSKKPRAPDAPSLPKTPARTGPKVRKPRRDLRLQQAQVSSQRYTLHGMHLILSESLRHPCWWAVQHKLSGTPCYHQASEWRFFFFCFLSFFGSAASSSSSTCFRFFFFSDEGSGLEGVSGFLAGVPFSPALRIFFSFFLL